MGFINNTTGYITSWYSPTSATPDYMLTNPCVTPSHLFCNSTCWVPNGIGGCQSANGNSAVGLVAYTTYGGSNVDWHEYIQAPMYQKLKAGVDYQVSFRATLGDASNRASEIHVNFSTTPITNFFIGTSPYVSTLNLPIHISSGNSTPPILNGVIADMNNWVTVSGVYRSTGNEGWITVGNFNTGIQTVTTPATPISCPAIYKEPFL
jgi:hypothetical protein